MALALAKAIREREARYNRNTRKVRAAVRLWLRDQNAEMLAGVLDEQVLSPELILPGYSVTDAADDLREAVREPLIIAAEEEAAFVFDANSRMFKKSLTPNIDRLVEATVGAMLSEDYWESIVKGLGDWTKRWLTRAFAKPDKVLGLTLEPAAVTSSETALVVTEEIKRKLPPLVKDLADDRSIAIAETETLGSMNGGGNAAGEALADIGEVETKTWITMRDERVRSSHHALHMKTIAEHADFNVGGSPAPHPGWWKLPIGQRIHCRCWLYHGPVDQDELNEIIALLDDELKEAV